MGADLLAIITGSTFRSPASWLTALSYAEAAVMTGCFILCLGRRVWGRWPFLFWAIAAEIAFELAGLSMLGRKGWGAAYFWTFWIGVAVQALLRLGVIGDILRSFPGLDFLPRKLYLVVCIAGATMAIASATTCFHHGSAREVQEWAVMLNHCVAMAWMAFSAVLLFSIKRLNFGWSPIGGRIAIGLFTRICVSGFVAQVFTDLSKHNRNMRLFMNSLDSVCTIAVFLFWIYTIIAYLRRDSFEIATNSERSNRPAIPPHAEKEEQYSWTQC